MRVVAYAAALALVRPAPLVAQPTRGPVLDMQDLVEAMGVKLPNGDDLARRVAEAERHPLGSELNPVRTDPVSGADGYLRRLRCPDGKRPHFHRVFSAGIGPFGRIIDDYKLTCAGRSESVFVDMYHRGHAENRAIPGYSIRRR